MAIKGALSNVFGAQETTYRCAYCSLSFDREPLNCPACGCPETVQG